MRLRLALEKSFVAALTETRGGVHDELRVAAERDGAIAGEIETMGGRPIEVGVVRSNLDMNQVGQSVDSDPPCPERFPIDAFFINAQAAPLWFVAENLMRKLVDAGTGFAGAGVAGDEPAATKLISFPAQTF